MKRIIIVGATSGIGLELSKIYIKKGWKVGIAGRREEKLLEIKKEYPTQVEYKQIDINNEKAPFLLQELITQLGGMDIYFHSSGIGYQNPELKEEIENNTVATNVLGFTSMVNSAFHYFKTKEKGHIAIISSIAGTKGLGVAPAYSATKRFQNTYIDALEQLSFIKKIPIYFTDIRPGFVATDLINGGEGLPLFILEANSVAKKIEKGLDTKKRRLTIDWKYKVLVFLWRLVPNWLWKRLPIKP